MPDAVDLPIASSWDISAYAYEDYHRPSHLQSESSLDSLSHPSHQEYHPSEPYFDLSRQSQETGSTRISKNQKRHLRRHKTSQNDLVSIHHYSPKRALTPIPIDPSPEYFEISQQSSSALSEPSSLRKLLILDLNGTLLYREKYKSRAPRQPYQHRVARPRAFMPSFRKYLFHPETRAWLDTMIWSSAKPYNVETMVEEAFDQDKTHLVAIWARDTLGLTSEEYHGKTQTTKDLTKPWAKIGMPKEDPAEHKPAIDVSCDMEMSDDEPPDLSLAPPSDPSSSANKDQSLVCHSARTTLLLDDSPLKARLQPWNHLCISEYTGALRQRDVATKQHTKTPMSDQPLEREDTQELSDEAEDKRGDPSMEKVQRRKRKREVKNYEYDRTLLAVIGILDALKSESNVAAWMCNEGLSTVGLHEQNGPQKRARLDDSLALSVPSSSVNVNNAPNSPPVPSIIPSSPEPLPSSQAPPLDSSPSTTIIELPQPIPSSIPLDKLTMHQTWFSNPTAVTHWAERGVKALQALGIEVEPGV